MPDPERGRSDRPARPARRPLDPHAVHGDAARTFFLCVAVSTTSDPDGHLLPLRVLAPARTSRTTRSSASGPTPCTSARASSARPGPSSAIGAYAVDRAQLIAGNPTPTIISFVVPPGATPYNTGDGLLPADLDGTTLPPAGSPNYFVGSMDQGGPYGAPQDALTLWKLRRQLREPAGLVLHADEHASRSRPTTRCSRAPAASRDCIPQPGDRPAAARHPVVPPAADAPARLPQLRHARVARHQPVGRGRRGPAAPSPASAGGRSATPPPRPSIFQEGTFAPGLTRRHPPLDGHDRPGPRGQHGARLQRVRPRPSSRASATPGAS